MQRQTVEHQLLTVDIERILQDTTAPETRRWPIRLLSPRCRPSCAPGPGVPPRTPLSVCNEAGYLKVTLEPAVIEQRFLALVGKSV